MRLVLEDDLERLVGQHLAGLQPLDVGGDADDAVRIVADQVGLDQMVADALGFPRVAAGGGEDGGAQPLRAGRVDVHEAPWE